ncbi:MAG TPA: YdcH family protein [Polyangia bacterium]|nr:YdcH family protein [Polyangia bacterium]
MEKIRVDVNSAAVEMVQLKERHGEIERRLAELDRHLSLTPAEQVERAQLKKEKLRAKDRLVLLSNVPTDPGSAPPGDPLPA